MKYSLTIIWLLCCLSLANGIVVAEDIPTTETMAVEHGPLNPYRESGTKINQQQADRMASKVRDTMVKRGDLSSSWKHVKAALAQQRVYQKEKEWVVVFENPSEAEPQHRKLYISLDLFGDVVDVNFTGQ